MISQLVQTIFRAATPENPRFNLNDPLAWDSLGAQPSSSGQRINREIAYTHSPWWRGVNLLATDVAKIHLHVMEIDNGIQTKATKHAVYFLLRRKPNDYQTAFTFRRQLTGHAITQGNGYAYIPRQRGGLEDGKPTELLPLDPEQTWPVRADGVLYYVTRVDGVERKLKADDVLHIKGFGYDGLQGYSVLDKARESLGLGIGSRKWQAIYYRNNGRPGIVLECAASVPDTVKEQLRTSWERMHAGLDNAHRTAILDRGLQAKTVSFNPQDSAVIETREMDIREIANFLGIPPHKLGDKSRSNYNTLEQENQDYLDESLDPWLVNWETECWDKLLSEEEKADESHEIVFARQAFVRADLQARANYYRTALGGAPWMKPNEVRAEEGLGPEENGDDLGRPKNMDYGEGADGAGGGAEQQPAKSPPSGPGDGTPRQEPVDEPAPPREGQDARVARSEENGALAEAIRDTAGRMVRRVCSDAKRAAGRDPKHFPDWIGIGIDKHLPVLREALGPLELAALAGRPRTGPALAEWLLQTLRGEFDGLCDRCTAAQLHQAVIDLSADLAERLPAATVRALTPL